MKLARNHWLDTNTIILLNFGPLQQTVAELRLFNTR